MKVFANPFHVLIVVPDSFFYQLPKSLRHTLYRRAPKYRFSNHTHFFRFSVKVWLQFKSFVELFYPSKQWVEQIVGLRAGHVR